MKKYYLFLSLFLCSFYPLFAQTLTVTATATESFCSNNGQITVQVIGGTLPYTYTVISAPTGVNRPPQATNVFNLLPSGSYNLGVKDANGATGSVVVQVTGNYSEPTLTSVTVTGSIATLTASGGKTPYKFAYSSNGGTTFTTPQDSSVFDCLPDGEYVFRVYDACDNFYSSIQSIAGAALDFTTTCKPNVSGGTDISTKPLSNAGAPFTFIVVLDGLDSIKNTTGEFRNLNACKYVVRLIDKCGRVSSKPFECADAALQLSVVCSVASAGTASIKAKGGKFPYRYVETTSNQTSSDGNFANLPLNKKYTFEVTDACGTKKQAAVSPLQITETTSEGCPFTGDLTVKTNQEITSDTACTAGCKEFSFFPITYTCTSCTPSVILTDNGTTKGMSSVIFKNLPEGTHTIQAQNACGDVTTKTVTMGKKPVPLATVRDCNLATINIVAVTNGSFYVYKDSAGVGLDSNSTGIFKIPYLGKFIISATNSACLPNEIRNDSFAKPTVSLNFKGCDSIVATPCPIVAGFRFVLRGSNGRVVDSNQTGIFSNLTKNTAYRLVLFNPRFADSIVENFTTDILPSLVADSIRCSSFCLKFNPSTWANQGNKPVRYNLKDNSGNLVASNLTGCFDNLNINASYTGEAVHPTCGMSTVSVRTLPGKISTYCLSPSSFTSPNGKCSFGWDVKLKPFANEYTLQSNANNVKITNKTGIFTNLPTGGYFLITECSRDSIQLPKPDFGFKATAGIACPNAATIRATGAKTDSAWLAFGKNLNIEICPSGPETYELRDLAGTLVAANTTGIFTALPSATPYIVQIMRGNCALDTALVTTRFYERAELSATFGVICAPATTGSFRASVTGGNAPFTFEITNPRNIAAPQITDSTFAFFRNLPANTYALRVFDRCGISSNVSTSVSDLNFTPQYRRLCGGTLELQVPNIDSAVYRWTNASGAFLGGTARIFVGGRVSGRFTVNVKANGCDYSVGVDVPNQISPDVLAQAGADFATTGASVNLRADSISATVVGRWSAINPSSGTSVFANVGNPKSAVTVSQVPGRYTFVWEINGGTNGCISTDTIVVTFCPTVSVITVLAQTTFTACNANTGKIILNASTTAKAPLSFKWSNGDTIPNLRNLAVGFYEVTVSDPLQCSNPVTQKIEIKKPDLTLSTSKNDVQCFGENNGIVEAKATGTIGVYTFKWSNQSDSARQSNLKAGKYVVTVTDSLNCFRVDSVVIKEPTDWRILATPDTLIALGDTIQLSASIAPAINRPVKLAWTPPQYLSCFDCFLPTVRGLNSSQVFKITATDSVGCVQTAKTSLRIDPSSGIYFPNAFSPNGDKNNDFFTIYGTPRVRKIKQLSVYSRWGNKVFETANINAGAEELGWDGTSQGVALPPDVFIFWAEIEYINGLTTIVKGDVTLMR